MDTPYFHCTLTDYYVSIPLDYYAPVYVDGREIYLNVIGHYAFIKQENIDLDYVENVIPVIKDMPLDQQIEILGLNGYAVKNIYRHNADGYHFCITDDSFTFAVLKIEYKNYLKIITYKS